MYIKEINITNIRSIHEFHWQMPAPYAGWHVLLGDNGAGKSSVLRAVAIALIGPGEAAGLRQNWNDWLRYGEIEGYIDLQLEHDETLDKFTRGMRNRNNLRANVRLSRDDDTDSNDRRVRLDTVHDDPLAERFIWSGKTGWFSASYGPFRRFSGGNPEYTRLFYSNPRLAAHLSVFGEDVALSEALVWLRELHLKRLERKPQGNLLEAIKNFVNRSGFLPHQVQLTEVSSDGVIFKDANGATVSVEELGDGHRSILSLVFELIRQLQVTYPDIELFSSDSSQVILPGVVLVDEIDAHLHPQWQRRIGRWLTSHFPKIQFIVTTHSPLVCQAAVNGSIWRLPTPGTALTQLEPDRPYQVMPDSEEWKRLVYGNILEAYSTDLFGEDIDRSPEAQAKYERLAELSLKELDEPLNDAEEAELSRLLSELPSTPYKRIIGADHD